MELSHTQAQDILLAAQGLTRHPDHTATKDDVRRIIQQMGALQIDTIHVVARSPYLVLWSRLGSYDPKWLDDLLAEGALFEYWSHAACFLPVENFPLYRRLMLQLDGWAPHWLARGRKWLDDNAEEAQYILSRIRANGGVRSSDFERQDGKASGWWDWKSQKMTLEYLLIFGEVMVARRHNFQRIYDLRERVMPHWDDSSAPPLDEVWRQFTLKTVQALGVTSAQWVADYFRMSKRTAVQLAESLANEGALLPATVEGWEQPAYIHPENLPLVEAAASGALRPQLTTLLSPFDPVVWDRDRALRMFNFDYRIECYTPAPKRRYGYFTLPILWKGALVGRLDAKAHRNKDKRFEVKALHLEPSIPPSDELAADLAAALRDCAAWHKTPDIDIVWSDPPDFAVMVKRALA